MVDVFDFAIDIFKATFTFLYGVLTVVVNWMPELMEMAPIALPIYLNFSLGLVIVLGIPLSLVMYEQIYDFANWMVDFSSILDNEVARIILFILTFDGGIITTLIIIPGIVSVYDSWLVVWYIIRLRKEETDVASEPIYSKSRSN